AAGEHVAVDARAGAVGRRHEEGLAPGDAADGQRADELAPLLQQRRRVRLRYELDRRPVVDVEEAAAAREARVAGMFGDLDAGGLQRHAYPAAAVGQGLDAAFDGAETALQHLAPAGAQLEAHARGLRVDV